MYQCQTTPEEAFLAQKNNILLQEKNALFQENQVRSQNEQMLYNAWVQEKQDREKLQATVQSLQQKMDMMMKEFQNQNSKNQAKTPLQYETDEEELEKEVAWVTVGKKASNKKRKMNFTPETSPEQQHTDRDDKTKYLLKKEPQPPPIIVSKIKDYTNLKSMLLQNDIEFKATVLNNEQIKLNVNNSENYRKTVNNLKDNNLAFHTYENKQTRSVKVMARGLPPNLDPEDVKKELLQKKFKITSVVNIIKKERKPIEKEKFYELVRKPLPLYMLIFEHDENIEKIYQIKTIQNVVIKIEAVKRSNLVPQCKRCQLFGHTQTYCAREAKCVKCAGKHLTMACTKPRNVKPKCVNCGQAHPANYRGCEVAKEFQKRRDTINQKIDENKNRKINPNYDPIVNKKMTYAQKIIGDTKLENREISGDITNEQIVTLLTKMNQTLNSFEQRLTLIEKLLPSTSKDYK